LTYDKFKEAVHPDDRESLDKAVLKAVEYKEPYNHYYRIIKPGGEIRSIHTKGQLITDDNGEVAHLLGVAQDITDQKAFEEELLNKTKELEMSNFELEKLAFIASHDLQEPLRKIMTFTSLLQKEIKHAQTSKTSLCIEKIEASCERMNTLINDVLDYSRFASKKT